MGICKCPKRKDTILFCYEHGVNVCDDCVVINHNTCVVQSYRSWLQDADYSTKCFCDSPLKNHECLRLTCYHIFHWYCIDFNARWNQCRECYICHKDIIPRKQDVSPVANTLRNKLSTVNWARELMGLELFLTEQIPSKNHTIITVNSFQENENSLSQARKNKYRAKYMDSDENKTLKKGPFHKEHQLKSVNGILLFACLSLFIILCFLKMLLFR